MVAITRRQSVLLGSGALLAALTSTALAPEAAEAAVKPRPGDCWFPSYRGINLGTAKLRKGSRGNRVKDLQRALNLVVYRKVNGGFQARLCPLIAEDGVFGNATYNRLYRFQADYGLGADGVVGPRSREALYSNYAFSKRKYG